MRSKTTWVFIAAAAALFAFIYLVEKPLREKANAARNVKIIPSFDSSTVKRIEIQQGGNRFRVERTNGSWTLTRPFIYPAAALPIEKLLGALTNLEWQSRLSAGDLKSHAKVQDEFGFTDPFASILFESDQSSLNVLIGTNVPTGGQVYFQVVGGPGIYLIDEAFLNFLPHSANDWRSTALFHFTSHLDGIKARSGNKGFTLTYTNASWRMVAPLPARADQAKIQDLLDKAAAAKVTKFQTDDPQADLASFGLQSPDMELSFSFGTNVLADLQIGQSPTNEPKQVFARFKDQFHIFQIPREVIDPWLTSHTNFLDRHLVHLPSTPIVELEIRGETPFVLRREGETWKLMGNNSFPLDVEMVRDVLKFLGRLEVAIEKDVVTDFASYGLVSPALQYTLKTAEGSNAIAAQIDFGTNSTGKIFTRRLDEYADTVKSVSPEDYTRLPRATWQFREHRIWNFSSNDVASVSIHQNGRDRKFIRNRNNEWSFAPGSQGIINPFELDEAILRLGQWKVVFWTSPNEPDPERHGFKKADYKITLEIKRDGKME
ncbi:MAG: DUF4340 domain-containing protein, partial [Verrucomicrobiota bacterium]